MIPVVYIPVSYTHLDVYKRQVCTLLGIQKLRTTPYHPQCNGLIERLHKTLADVISHFVSPDGKDWDEIVPSVLMAYRSAPHVATGFSPHMLLFGQEMNLPEADDLALKPEVDDDTQIELDCLVEKLRRVREVAIHNSENSKDQNKKYYDKKCKLKPYITGDYVYLHDPTVKRRPRKKFGKSWKGPYKVIEVLNELNSKIRTNKGESVVHYNRLKPSKVSNGNANRIRRPRQSTQLDNSIPNIDPELNSTADTTACVNESNNRSSILMLPPRPIIDLADDIDLTDEEQDESSEREDAELNERAQADDTIIDAGAQVDLG